MYACKYGVGAFAGEGEAVLDEDLDVVEPGLEEGVGERGQAAFPGPYLSRRGHAAVLVAEVLGQMQRQRPFEDAGGHGRRGLTQQQENAPGSTKKTRAGGGMSSGVRRAGGSGSPPSR